MAKRSGNRGSRGERRAGKQRVERARERGLPERREPEPRRPRAASTEPGTLDGEPRPHGAAEARAATRSGIPPLAKVGAVALLLLGAAYALTHWRDREVEPSSASPGPALAASGDAQPAPAEPAPSVQELPVSVPSGDPTEAH